jgi:hypothetical protein
MKPTQMAIALVAIFAFSAPVAHGQARGDAKKEAKERKEEKKGDKGAKDEGSADAAPHPSEVLDLPKPGDTKKDRDARRRRAIALTRARWGALVLDSAVQAELRLHARRIARIDAMERVARSSGKDALLPRIDRLRSKEIARFEKRMDWLKDENHRDGG